MMQFLGSFFSLRWNMPRWGIPTVWTIYVLNQLYSVWSIAYSTIMSTNYPPMAQRWQNIADSLPRVVFGIIQFAGSQLLFTAIFGILLFDAQRSLFGKSI